MDATNATFALIAFAALALVAIAGFRRVPQGHEWTLERFGRYRRTLAPGIHLLLPLLERIGRKQDIRERALPIEPFDVVTRERLSVQVVASGFVQVIDAARASYEVDDLEGAVRRVVVAELSAAIGAATIDALLADRAGLAKSVAAALDPALEPWGVRITRLDVGELSPPPALLADVIAERHAAAAARVAEEAARAELITVTQRAEQALALERIEQTRALERLAHERGLTAAAQLGESERRRAESEAERVGSEAAAARAAAERSAAAIEEVAQVDRARVEAELERIAQARDASLAESARQRTLDAMRHDDERERAERAAAGARAGLDARIAGEAMAVAAQQAAAHEAELARIAAARDVDLERLACERERLGAERAAASLDAEIEIDRRRRLGAVETEALEAEARRRRLLADAESRRQAAERDAEALDGLRARLQGSDRALLAYLAAREHALALAALAGTDKTSVVVNVPVAGRFDDGG